MGAGRRNQPDNLYALCPRHHQLKTETGWTYQPQPDGDLLWTSPTGRQYRSQADRHETEWADDTDDTAATDETDDIDPDPPPF